MRGADLIGCRVLDSTGERVGTVHDLRLVIDASAGGAFRYRLDALVCGAAGVGDRLGYTTGEVRGPWLLDLIFGRVYRRALLVPWADVVAVEDRRIRLRRPRGEIPTLNDPGERAP